MIKIIDDLRVKSDIARLILEDLPEWFGIESALEGYIESSKTQTFIAFVEEGRPLGFCTLEVTGEKSCDMHVLGVLKECQGKAIGTQLVKAAEYHARQLKKSFMTVKTLSALHPDENYAKTRWFYEKMGYIKLETLTTLWDESNPCDYYLKPLKTRDEILINETLRLRRVMDSDYSTAIKWYTNKEVLYFSENITDRVYDRSTINDMYNYLKGIGDLYFIEVFDEVWHPIGDVTLSPNTMPICIGDPSYFGKGIGTKVINALLNEAKTLGFSKISLHGIYKHNPRSYKMFQNCGFKLIREDDEKFYLTYTF